MRDSIAFMSDLTSPLCGVVISVESRPEWAWTDMNHLVHCYWE